MKPFIAPSMLSADFGNLAAETLTVNESEAGWFHLDIMDGVFVPNISFGFPVCKAIAALARKPMDAHLMIVEPDKYVQRFADLGVEWLSIHYEACSRPYLRKTLSHIRQCGMKAGLAINPATPVECVIEFLREVDYVVVMGVNPGFSGQKFFECTTEKVAVLKEIIDASEANVLIQVDGGVDKSNIRMLRDAGATSFVAGSAAFAGGCPKEAIAALTAKACEGLDSD